MLMSPARESRAPLAGPLASSIAMQKRGKDRANKKDLEQNLCTFLISPACQKSTLVNCSYWYVIVMCEDQDIQSLTKSRRLLLLKDRKVHPVLTAGTFRNLPLRAALACITLPAHCEEQSCQL
ncbi:hypothetical protein GJAV_G00105450 [Gymnothorax javanicus]|nr:hypothetical protein GJAV_G00105450 [Gymnothorax javanicus]